MNFFLFPSTQTSLEFFLCNNFCATISLLKSRRKRVEPKRGTIYQTMKQIQTTPCSHNYCSIKWLKMFNASSHKLPKCSMCNFPLHMNTRAIAGANDVLTATSHRCDCSEGTFAHLVQPTYTHNNYQLSLQKETISYQQMVSSNFIFSSLWWHESMPSCYSLTSSGKTSRYPVGTCTSIYHHFEVHEGHQNTITDTIKHETHIIIKHIFTCSVITGHATKCLPNHVTESCGPVMWPSHIKIESLKW